MMIDTYRRYRAEIHILEFRHSFGIRHIQANTKIKAFLYRLMLNLLCTLKNLERRGKSLCINLNSLIRIILY